MKKLEILSFLCLVVLAFCIGHYFGYNSGQRETQISMSHFLSATEGNIVSNPFEVEQ